MNWGGRFLSNLPFLFFLFCMLAGGWSAVCLYFSVFVSKIPFSFFFPS